MKFTEKQKDDLLNYLLYEKYLSEFIIEDGLKQHPKGIGFSKWLEDILEKAGL